MGGEFDERAVFAAGPVVVFQWRNEPGWPVDYVSPNAAEVFGYGPDEFLDGTVAYGSLIHEDDAARVASEVERASLSGERSFVHEPYRVRHKDGSLRWLYDSTRIRRRQDGSAELYLGYVIDISARVAGEEEKRELERRLLQAQKLESLGILAGGVAHDFNNVLTGIMGHAGLVARNLETDAERARSGLEQIERLAARASLLTRQLLAYAGKRSFVVEPLDVSEIVVEMVGMLEPAEPVNATVKLELEESLPAVVADRGEIQQVVMNLLTNAYEAIEDQAGSVTIRLSRCDEGKAGVRAPTELTALEGDLLCLEVSDTGRGMTPEVREKLFDPFFTTKESGRGLGMSAVLGIVRGHGGAISVQTAPGEGTTFRLWLPASTPPPATRQVPPAPERWRGAGTVLVVDDERTVRWILAEVLADMGLTALVAENGAEALTLFRRHAEDVVLALVDMTMPVMGGAATLAALREIAPGLPIVMMSGFSAEHAVDQLRDASRTAFLEKPYGVAQVEEVVRRLLGPHTGPERV